MAKLTDQTLYSLRGLLEAGQCSAKEIAADLINAVRERDREIKAYVQMDEESIMRQAEAADAARARGESGDLLGLPVAVKDLFNVKGDPCACASKILKGYVAPYDATAIANLRAAGVVLAGRTNMDEFAMGSSTENSAFFPTRNPWNLDCVPGGSSGGSAAAVSAGEALAALGSDTGGSVRQPAAFCGCVGLKPSYGRISRYGVTAFASSIDQVGTLTRDVRDAAMLLKTIAGYDPLDSTSVNAPTPDYPALLGARLDGLRLGLPKEYFIGGLDPDVERFVRAAIEQCRALGATIVDVSLPMTPHAIAAYYIIACAEASSNLARFDGIRFGFRAGGAEDPIDLYCRTRAAGFGAEVKRRIILGTYVLSSGYYDAYYVRAQKVRTLIRHDFERVFEQCDVLISPVTPTPAYRLGEKNKNPLQMYLDDLFTVPVNLAGICALALPCGLTGSGLPVGMQIIGPAFKEEAPLRVGHAYQQVTDWHLRTPPRIEKTGQVTP